MKIRKGFVSNSSSSSFIVNNSDIFEIRHMPKDLKDKKTLYVPQIYGGEIEFSRQRENYTDFGSRLNWAYMQAKYLNLAYTRWLNCQEDEKSYIFSDENITFARKHRDDISILEEVLKEHLKLDKIEWHIVLDCEEEWSDADGKNFYTVRPKGEIPYMQGYIDHQSKVHNNPEEYAKIFEDKESIFQWLFGKDNYIACRSDEYSDAGSLEVDHCQDYVETDLYDLGY